MTAAIFDREYHCWRNNEYLGTAMYVDDEHIGPAFVNMIVDELGQLVHDVLIPDKFELV